jgi:translation initiation factor 5B
MLFIRDEFQSIYLGRVVSIELNHKALDLARKGAEVCIKIEAVSGEAPKMFGRHFDENDLLMSKVIVRFRTANVLIDSSYFSSDNT